MSFKALLLSGLGKQKESVEVIKATIGKSMANMTNATCWHIYGIINRKDK